MLSSHLRQKWALKNIVNTANGKDKVARVNAFEIYGLASEMFNEVRSNVVHAGTANVTNKLSFGQMLEGYFLAYERGQFILRDGTVLGKPTYGTTNNSSGFTITIPDSTMTGVATVFMEAVSDFGFGTPLFYTPSNSVTYSPVYISADQLLKSGVKDELVIWQEPGRKGATIATTNALVQLYKPTFATKKDFFLNGKTPTAAAFVPCMQVVTNYAEKLAEHGGLTADEAQFIRSVSNLTESEAKALGGLLVRSFGSVGAGGGHFAIGSAHLSLGDNQVLAQIVESLLSSFSSHVAEHELTEVFWKYDGDDRAVNDILSNYKAILAKITAQ